jgi:antitoxin CptB
MTGGAACGNSMEVRRRRLLFRSWHRGIRELDLVLGRFAEAVIAELTPDDLTAFERLIEVPDRELLAWVMGELEVPENYDSALFRRLRDFNRGGAGAR